MLKLINRCQPLGHLLACSAFLLPTILQAELIQTDDYIYVAVEAEDHDAKDDRWVLTEPGTPTLENDPDGNHSDQASGQRYLELLPDMRVTHEDTFGPPTAYWGQAGQGPFADYTLEFPEAGRYYVHMRAYSTGTEDNGIHVGLNGAWPQSSRNMQFCTASRRAWWWSSAQRNSGGDGSCGKEKTIWLDIPSAGTHTVSISAREDGFEIDRLALVKDLSGNTKVCTPNNINNVSCVNGSIESADGFIDMRIRLSVEPSTAIALEENQEIEEYEVGQSLQLSAKLENLDSFDTATEIVATVEFDLDDWVINTVDEECVLEENVATCSLSSLAPTVPNEFDAFVFDISAKAPGAHRIDASVVALEIDESSGNDITATHVDVVGDAIPSTDVSVSITSSAQNVVVGESFSATALVSNLSDVAATQTTISFTQPNNIEFNASAFPSGCAGSAVIVCELDALANGASHSFTMDMLANTVGTHVLSVSLTNNNDDNASNNESTILVIAEQGTPNTVETGDSTDTGATTEGATDGSTTDAGSEGSTTDAVNTDSGSSDGASTTANASDNTDDSDSGSAGLWLLMLLSVYLLTSGYRWHQREYVVISE